MKTNKYDTEIQCFIRSITPANFATEATSMIRHWEKKPAGTIRLLEKIRVFFRTPPTKHKMFLATSDFKGTCGQPYTLIQKDFLLGIASYCEGKLGCKCRKEYTGDLPNDKIW